jgi:hypothetical protein
MTTAAVPLFVGLVGPVGASFRDQDTHRQGGQGVKPTMTTAAVPLFASPVGASVRDQDTHRQGGQHVRPVASRGVVSTHGRAEHTRQRLHHHADTLPAASTQDSARGVHLQHLHHLHHPRHGIVHVKSQTHKTYGALTILFPSAKNRQVLPVTRLP